MTNVQGQTTIFGDVVGEAAQTTVFGELVEDTANMKVSLNIKQPSEFFWLRKIRGVNIAKCCAECFIGERVSEVYDQSSKGRTPCVIEVDVAPSSQYIAYYLCGLAKSYNYQYNTHVAFVYEPGETLNVTTSQIELSITNARRIDFQAEKYVPNPLGSFTNRQIRCRNWIFANYIRDGLVK